LPFLLTIQNFVVLSNRWPEASKKKQESFEQKNSSTSMHVPMHRCYNKNDFKIFYYSLIFYSYPFNNLNHLRSYYAAPLVYIKK
jgi:hypothetical protein